MGNGPGMSADTIVTTAYRFSHDDVRSREGLVTWREVIGRTLARLDLSLLPDRPFHSDVDIRTFPGGVGIGFMACAGMRMDRTRDLVADGDDDLVLYFCASGGFTASQRRQEVTLGRDHALPLSHAEIGSITVPSASQFVMIRLPYASVAARVPHLDDALMRPLPPANAAVQLLVSYARSLHARELTASGLQHLVANHVRDLVVAALGAPPHTAISAEPRGIRAARLRAIKADVAQRLGDGGLSVRAVAARHGVSPRYVQMLFEEDGTSFSAFVRNQRLAWAYRLLTSPRATHRSVSAIAFDTGFGDLSYFNRAFRRLYGATPSGVRGVTIVDGKSTGRGVQR